MRVKINTALVICLAFVFRLLFLNISVIPSLNTQRNSNFINEHFSTLMKRRKSVDILSNSNTRENSAIEICEENSGGEDDLSKTNPFILARILYSFLADKAVSLRVGSLFNSVHCKLFSRKYLALSVLRI